MCLPVLNEDSPVGKKRGPKNFQCLTERITNNNHYCSLLDISLLLL